MMRQPSSRPNSLLDKYVLMITIAARMFVKKALSTKEIIVCVVRQQSDRLVRKIVHKHMGHRGKILPNGNVTMELVDQVI
ncbi:MAG TPA: hypothetical protein DIS59_04980 [Candidatus Magasanikbacteria bacterium]|nr:hypothetical protein [Candidatus Magasanikbacteria bacterium]